MWPQFASIDHEILALSRMLQFMMRECDFAGSLTAGGASMVDLDVSGGLRGTGPPLHSS